MLSGSGVAAASYSRRSRMTAACHPFTRLYVPSVYPRCYVFYYRHLDPPVAEKEYGVPVHAHRPPTHPPVTPSWCSRTGGPSAASRSAPTGETFGEAVFSTGMSGYQETLTDPSYHRQVVVMTAPHVGNTGMNDEDPESARIWVSGYVVRDPARVPSSWRSSAPSTTSCATRASSASPASTPAR